MDVGGEGVSGTYVVGTDAQGDVAAELALESLVVFLFQGAHVVGDVLAEDVGAVDLSVEALRLAAVAREAFD